MPKLCDPIKIMATEKAAVRARYIHRWCKKHNLNWYKVLCLRWQSSTGKKCTNKKHLADIYEDKLECEAQLTESLLVNLSFGSMTDEEWVKFRNSLEVWAQEVRRDNAGCA